MPNFNSCSLDAGDVSRLVEAQNPRIYLEILQKVNTESPWSQIIPSAVAEANMGDTIESVITPRAVTNQNQVAPEFSGFVSEACTLEAVESQMGNIRFSSVLGVLRGKSPLICLAANWDTVYGALEQSVQALTSEIKYTYDADVQYQLVTASGVKAAVIEGQSVPASIEGDEYQVNTPWPAQLPNGNITFAYVKALLNFLMQEFTVTPFGSGSDQHAKLIASAQVIDAFRNEAGPNNALSAATTGGYADGKNGLWEYLWVDYNFRGLKFAENRYPLRYNEVDQDGNPVFIAPRIKVAVTASNSGQGYRLARNPAWSTATYEVAVLVFKDAFRRRVPAQFVGQGQIKFPSQNFGGDLQWVFRPDMGCNLFADKGLFTYQIARAFQAVSPHSIVPISYRRCPDNYGIQSCDSSSE